MFNVKIDLSEELVNGYCPGCHTFGAFGKLKNENLREKAMEIGYHDEIVELVKLNESNEDQRINS